MSTLEQIRATLTVTPPVMSAHLTRLDPQLLHVNEGEGTWSPLTRHHGGAVGPWRAFFSALQRHAP